MRNYITLPNVIYLVLISFSINSCMLTAISPYLLIPSLFLFFAMNIAPGVNPRGAKKVRTIL
ncbi:MAG: hypothetical protein J6R89_06975, partial [Clostridia bacterium]|nr:hypothetical protein [Clostridia bacterium]